MGLLADFFVSRDDKEAVAYNDSQNLPEIDRAQYKNILSVEVSILWAIMRGIEWDASFLDDFPCILVIEEGERLIHKFPSGMLADLCRLTPEKIGALVSAWADTEELEGWKPEETRAVIEDLIRLGRRAMETSRNLYLWNCV